MYVSWNYVWTIPHVYRYICMYMHVYHMGSSSKLQLWSPGSITTNMLINFNTIVLVLIGHYNKYIKFWYYYKWWLLDQNQYHYIDNAVEYNVQEPGLQGLQSGWIAILSQDQLGYILWILSECLWLPILKRCLHLRFLNHSVKWADIKKLMLIILSWESIRRS